MSIEELATMLGEQITAEKAKAWDEGYRAGVVAVRRESTNPYRTNEAA